MTFKQQENLIKELNKLHERKVLSETVTSDYFEPGMMEYPEQYDAHYDVVTGKIMMRFQAKGTRYEGRTEQIEKVQPNDPVQVIRDSENAYNSNNFTLLTIKGKSLGNMPAELCNAIAPLYDNGELIINNAKVSFVDPISKRSRHAKQAVLFIELTCKLNQ